MYARVRAHEIEVRFVEPLGTPGGTFETRRSVLVSLERNGYTGWGEAPAFPSGRWGTSEAAWTALTDPSLLAGAAPVPPIASAAWQAAEADLAAREVGAPMHSFLGGTRKGVTSRQTFGLISDPEDLVERVGAAVESGIRAVKLKITPGWDVVPVRALRSQFPDLDIALDANMSYQDPRDPVFDELAALEPSHIEQPLPAHDLVGHRALRERGVRVCLDEAITSLADARTALDAGAADMLTIKVNRLGLESARTLLALTTERQVGMKVGGTFDTAIGRRHLLAFATLDGVDDAEVSPPGGYLVRDIAPYPGIEPEGLFPDETPGIGIEPDWAALAALEIRSKVLTS